MTKGYTRFRFVSIILLCVLLLAVGLNHGYAQSEENRSEITEIVVKLSPMSGATIEDINSTYDTTTVAMLMSSQGIYLLQAPPGTDVYSLADQMALDVRLLYAEPNFIGEAPEGVGRGSWDWGGPDRAPYNQQYALDLLGVVDAHDISRGTDVVVAVLDRGFQLDHPALAAHYTDVRYDFVDDDVIPEDELNRLDDDGDGIADETYGHGSHVAGIVLLAAPEAQIMPLRVLDTEGRGNIFTLAEAIRFAVAHGADVINLSLGTEEKSDLLKEVTRQATQQGVTVVAAAGNLDSKKKQYPAANQCVLAVTSIGPNKTKSDFANFGSWVAYAVPGESIYSTLPSSGYGWWSGTSMAAPFVAGQAALIHSHSPSLSVRQIADLITGTSQRLRGKLDAHLTNMAASVQRLDQGDLPSSGGTISGGCSKVDEETNLTITASNRVTRQASLEGVTTRLDSMHSNYLAEDHNLTQQVFLPLIQR